MKNKYLLILIFLFSASLGINAQNCNFNYNFNTGALNIVNFSPNSAFSPNLYSFAWDFNDGSTSTNVAPTHTFNSLPPYVVCYEIFDSTNVRICSACDTITNSVVPVCTFSAVQTSSLVVVFQAATSPGSLIYWDFGDGMINVIPGNPITHIYASSGTYNVCMTEIESATGDTLCNTCNLVTVTSTSNNCYFTSSNSPASIYTYDFTAGVTGGSVVTWDFGDNSTGSGIQTHHTYNSIGTFTVCMFVTDTNGITCQYCDYVNIGSSHGNCYFTYAPDSSLFNTVTFSGLPAYAGNFLSWDFGDGTTGSGNTISHTFNSNGPFTVCMYETDSTGIVVCSSCDIVTLINIGNCFFTASTNPLSNLTIDFQANSGFFSTVSWDFGDSTVGTGGSVSHTFANPGTYNVCIAVSTPGAVNCTYCQLVTVPNSTGTCIISYMPDSSPLNGFFFSIQPSTTSSTISWDFGDGSVDTGSSVHHVFLTGGLYTVCAIERDSLQNIICQTCVTVQVGNNPPNCQASFLATNLALTAYFIDLSIVNSSSVSYSWDFGDGTNSTNRFPQHTYAAPGVYNACLTIISGNCTDTYCNAVLVDTTVFNPTGCRAFFALVQLAPYQVTVVNLSGGINLSFNWDFGDGSTDTQPYPSHFYNATGSYNLCLTVSDGSGCTDTYCDTLSVDSLGNIFRTVPGFSINVLMPSQLTGVNEINSNKSFRVFPNPATSELYINLTSGAEKATGYRILSVQGAEVLRGKLNGTDGKVNIQSLNSGSYLLEISTSDGSRSFRNIIKN